MKRITQAYIAKCLKVTPTFINSLVKTKKRPNWKRAKQLAELTKTDPVLWLEGTSEEIRSAIYSPVES